MHHDVCWSGGGAAEEDPGVAVHGCLVGWYGSVEFPHYDRFGMIEQVVADAGNVFDHGYAKT